MVGGGRQDPGNPLPGGAWAGLRRCALQVLMWERLPMPRLIPASWFLSMAVSAEPLSTSAAASPPRLARARACSVNTLALCQQRGEEEGS